MNQDKSVLPNLFSVVLKMADKFNKDAETNAKPVSSDQKREKKEDSKENEESKGKRRR